MNHLIISLSWQGDYWQDRPTNAEMEKSGHGYAKEGNLPWERQNFNFNDNVLDNYKYGFVQTRGVPSVYENGKGIVFFYSNNYIVGFYARAEINKQGFPTRGVLNSDELNIRAPIELCVRWQEISCLPVKKDRYYVNQTRMSQAGALNIEDEQAWNIIEDAIAVHSDAPEVQRQLQSVKTAIWGGAGQMENEWLVKLRDWLAEGNPKTMPEWKHQLRAEFVEQFPISSLQELTLQQYAVGYPNSLAHWIAIKTKHLGGIGGATVGKFGVLLKQNGVWLIDGTPGDEQQAGILFLKLKTGLRKIVDAAQVEDYAVLDSTDNALYAKRTLRSKLLYLYFPDEFLPVFSQDHLQHFLSVFGQQAVEGKLMASNRKLWYIQNSLPELAELDTQQFKDFLYHCFSPSAVTEEDTEAVELEPPAPLPIPEAVKPLLRMAGRTRNILLYGPPGTGKTWLVTQFAKAFTDPSKVEMVTFHQSFAYEEFVEGIKPVIVGGQVAYTVVDGVFKRVCKSAEADPNGKYLLIIDEINRANIAKVLGELITLIEDDKRVGPGQTNALQVRLPYSGELFGVPKNLTILGTMNTADRSIALLDLALRRRFTFVEMPPDPSLLPSDVAGVNLEILLTRMNQRIAALLDPDHRIGHSYLMGIKTEDDLHFAWYHRVVPLLQEYFYHDGERMQAVIGKVFVKKAALEAETKEALGAAYEDAPRYEIVPLTGEDFQAALRKIAE